METPKDFWDRVSGIYDTGIDGLFGNDLRLRVRERLGREPDPGRTVEFGCGTGYFTEVLAGRATSLVATDISEKMLGLARERFREMPEVGIRNENCEKTSFADASFDTAFIGLTFHFVDGPRTLAEMRRILRPGGTLVLAVPTMEGVPFPAKIRGLLRNYRAYGTFLPPGSRMYTRESVTELLIREGFRPDDVSLITDPAHPGGLPGLWVRAVRT